MYVREEIAKLTMRLPNDHHGRHLQKEWPGEDER